MSKFECELVTITIEKHPNADRLEIAKINDYICIVEKGIYKSGDTAIYIPEGAIVPKNILDELGLELAGKDKNRVKAIKLRKILSQGILYPITGKVFPKFCPLLQLYAIKDLALYMGIKKYEPVLPTTLSGEVKYIPTVLLHYEIENIKKFPTLLHKDEKVVITEKIHGTLCRMSYISDEKQWYVSSKGLGNKGFVFETETNKSQSIYITMFKRYTHVLDYLVEQYPDRDITLLGEIYGVQDLKYDGNKDMLLFDVHVQYHNFLTWDRLSDISAASRCPDNAHKLRLVPLFYIGNFTEEVLKSCTSGQSLLGNHIREGCVIKPYLNRYDDLGNRVIVKSVSEKYLTRSGDVTEYE